MPTTVHDDAQDTLDNVIGIQSVETGGTGVNMGATGGTGHVVKQASVGAAFTTGTVAVTDVADNAITNAKLRDSAAVSVIGRSANTSGDPADIVASANGGILLRRYDTLSFVRDVINLKDFDAIGDGVADDTSAIQAALTYLRDNGGVLDIPFATYKCTSALLLQRSSASHSTSWTIRGNGATFSFTTLAGSATALTIGATSTSFFAEVGGIHISDLKLLGPEANGAGGGSTNTTTTTGALFEFAGRVYLENVQVPNWYNAIRTRFAFPFTAVNTQTRNSYIGVWHDEASNLQKWINTGCNQCRYGVLFKATTTNLDSGKMNNIVHDSLHLEGTRVGVHIDPGSTDTTVKIEQVRIIAPYAANSTYDSIRAGMEWTFGTPQTRGLDTTNFTVDLRVEDGFWNLTPDADTAAIAFGSNGKTRHVFVDIPVPPLEDNANTIAGTPGGGSRIILRPRASGTGKHTEYIYNNTPARSVRRQSSGRTLIGAAKVATGDLATVGLELEENGVVWATASGNPALRLNRTTSDGTVATFNREGVLKGAINVASGGATFASGSTSIGPTASTFGVGAAAVTVYGRYDAFASAAGVGNGAVTTDEALWTPTAIPANTLTANGDAVVLELFMRTGATGNDKRVGVTVGGTQINSSVTTANAVNFKMSCIIQRISATAVNVFITCAGGVGVHGSSLNLAVADLTANTLAIVVTGASPTTGAANDVVLHDGLELIAK